MNDIELKEWFKKTYSKVFNQKNLKPILLEASSAFYNTEDLIMSNEKYDLLRAYYIANYGPLPVGAKVTVGSTLELSHNYSDFAGTLSKCKNIEDVKEWLRVKKIPDNELMVSIKGDGHSITIEWVYDSVKKKLVLDKALTRGEDGVGKDLTAIFAANLKQIPVPGLKFDCAIGYEAVVKYPDFEELSKQYNSPYKNPRSALSGIISESGQHLFPFVTLLPIRIKAKEEENELTRAKQIDILSDLMLGKDNLDFGIYSIHDLETLYEQMEDMRAEGDSVDGIPFMFDGLVIETVNEKVRKRLGHNSSEPNYATALKFAPLEKETIVTDVKWSSEGISSIHTPVIHFKPVVIRGNTYKQVSLANYGRFIAMKLKKGDEVLFALRNDTLGYIEKLETPANKLLAEDKTVRRLKAPINCTSCNDLLVTEETSTFLFCDNPECKLNIVGDIVCFINKHGVKNIGRKTIETLVDNDMLQNPAMLFELDYEAMAKLEGQGKTSAANFKKELNKVFSKDVKDFNFLGALNIPMWGRSRAKLLFEHFTFSEVYDVFVNPENQYECLKKDKMSKKIAAISGLGDGLTELLVDGLVEKTTIIKALLAYLVVQNSRVERAADFVKLSFCHTGSALPLDKRDTLKELIESKGHAFVSSVSSKLDYLINNDSKSTTGKNKAAIAAGVDIISVQEVIDLLK